MNGGKIVEQGEAKQVFQHPQDPYTKMLLGAALSLLHPARRVASLSLPCARFLPGAPPLRFRKVGFTSHAKCSGATTAIWWGIGAPCPSIRFRSLWKDRMAEADAVGLDYATETASVTDAVTCQLFDLWYTGMCGARLHAKYLKPVSDEPMPLVLQFHGYPGASRQLV